MKKFGFFLLALFLFVPLSTFALTNYDTKYDLHIQSIDLTSYTNVAGFDNALTMFQSLDSIDSPYYNKIFLAGGSGIANEYLFYVFLVPKSVDSFYFNIFYNTANTNKFNYYVSATSFRMYYISLQSGSSASFTAYNNVVSCLTSDNCAGSFLTSRIISYITTGFATNNTSNRSYNLQNFFYKSDIPLKVFDSTTITDSNYLFKTLVIDDVTYNPGDVVPPVIYTPPVEPEPEPPPEPFDGDFSDYVYWFIPRDDSVEVLLENIYVLLFIYCNFIIITKLITYIKNSKL